MTDETEQRVHQVRFLSSAIVLVNGEKRQMSEGDTMRIVSTSLAARIEELEKAIESHRCSCIFELTDPDRQLFRTETCWRCDTLQDLGLDRDVNLVPENG